MYVNVSNKGFICFGSDFPAVLIFDRHHQAMNTNGTVLYFAVSNGTDV